MAVEIDKRFQGLTPLKTAEDIAEQTVHSFRINRIDEPEGPDEHYSCEWLILTRNNPDLLAALQDAAAEAPPPRPEIPLWTDDQTNLFQILK